VEQRALVGRNGSGASRNGSSTGAHLVACSAEALGLRHKGEMGESSAGIKASGMCKGEYQICQTHDVIRPTQDCGATVAVGEG
jgi:hypothetical protein